MGQDISVGVATKVLIYRIRDWKEVMKRIDKEFGLDIYDIVEADSSKAVICLKLKENLLVKEIIPLLKQIIPLCGKDFKDYINESLDKLQNIDNLDYNKMMDVANERRIGFCFTEGNIVCNDLSYVVDYNNASAYGDIINFIFEGKVFMECYSDMFYFLRNSIIKNLKSPIKKAIVVSIIG